MQGKNHNYFELINQHAFIDTTMLWFTNKEQIESLPMFFFM